MDEPVTSLGSISSTLEADGERFLPEQMHGSIALEHHHRYIFASQLAVDKVVLDIASGEGYGSAYLAKFAHRVVGVDIAKNAVAHANEKYVKDNLEYRVGSCLAIPLEDHSVDLVVSFETIEHHREHEAMMLEIKRVLRPRGILVISSPDKLEYSDKPAFHNPFHIKELYREEFESLLAEHFKNVKLYGQRVMLGSALFGQNGAKDIAFQKIGSDTVSVSNVPDPLYWVALASDEIVPEASGGLFEQPLDDLWHDIASQRNAKIAELIKAISVPDSGLLKEQLHGSWYLQQNPDIVAAGVDVYEHWFNNGMAEGRLPAADLIQFAQQLVSEREDVQRAIIEEKERELRQARQESIERDHAFAAQLTQLQQAASQERAAQAEAAQQQMFALAEQHAQREEALQLAIEEKERELRQGRHESLERQRILEAEIAQNRLKARYEVDAQLRTLVERERAFGEQLTQLQQAANQERAAQVDVAEKQMATLTVRHAQREEALQLAIEEKERELRQGQYESLERQRILEAEIAQTRLKARYEVDAQLRTLAERERAFGEQLTQLQHAANQERAAQVDAAQKQMAVMAELYTKQEDALRNAIEEKKRESRQAQQELRELQNAAAQDRCSLKKQYGELLFDLNNKLVAIRSSWAWRLTTPLRFISGYFGDKADFNPIDHHQLSILLASQNSGTYKHHDSINVGKDTQEMPIADLTPQTISAVKKLDELLSYDDEAFVTCAYLTLFGRAPDPEGFAYYIRRLNKTGDKFSVLHQMYRGTEARQFNANIAGLKAAMRRYSWRQLPVLRAIEGLFGSDEKNVQILSSLRKIERQMAFIQIQAANKLGKTDTNQIPTDVASTQALFRSFDPDKYLVCNPDVAAADINPYEHFMRNGLLEGRAIHCPTNDEPAERVNASPRFDAGNISQTIHMLGSDNQIENHSNNVERQPAFNRDAGDSKKDIASYFMQPACEALQDDGYTFTRLMHYIWDSRLDLQKAFDIYAAPGRLEFCKWFLSSAYLEYGLTPEVYPLDLLDMLVSVGGGTGEKAQWMLDEQKKCDNQSEFETEPASIQSGSLGANLVGYAFGEFGMGEHVRMVARSLNASATSFCIIDQDVGVHGAGDLSVSHWVTDAPKFDINIFHINADVFPPLYFKFGKSFFSGRYNIGYWAWELSKCPSEFDTALNMVDEVWSISDFVTESFSTRSPVPVITMPLAVTVPTLDPLLYSKAYYGLPEDKFIFFFTFDAASYLDRKNPIAVVRAFRLAFPIGDENAHLLFKTMNIEVAGPLWKALLEEIDDDPRITVISKRLTRDEVLGLNLACDAFVSLHRSEGFGRCVAEAMAYGKPVVVTNYSGTRDFAKEETACVVDYQLVPVPEGAYPFWKDQVWADPDIDHAAVLMQTLFSDENLRSKIASAGQHYVLENFNELVVGERYAARLVLIQNRKLNDDALSENRFLVQKTIKSTSALFTIVSKNYLAYARTLLNSVANVHPEFELFLCLVDEVDGYFNPSEEPFSVVTADQLGIATFTDMKLRYDIMELNTAVKPFMFRWLFDNFDIDTAIYIDPDIRVYSRLDQLFTEFDRGASIILTPHISKPLEDGMLPDDHSMLQAGVFNLGFIATKRCSETIDFIDWWGRKLLTKAVSDLSNNLFTDQKWCDLAPCFLDNLKVLKHPGYNVAYWNLAQRHIEKHPGDVWYANSEPIVFFHFSGINPKKSEVVSKHQNRFGWEDINSDCQALFVGYIDELLKNGWETTSQWPYAYGTLPDSFYVAPVVRQLYRAEHPNSTDFLDEADMAGYLIELCNQPFHKEDLRITRLMDLIYRLRPDLQSAFNLSNTDGRNQFVDWFNYAASAEYKLPTSLVN